MKKRKTLLIIIFIILVDVLVFYVNRAKDYEITYKTNNGEIVEKYDKKLKMYSFTININNKKYETVSKHDYIHTKKLIHGVSMFENGDTICVYLMSDKVELYPICNDGNELISYSLVNRKDEFYKLKSVNEDKKTVGNINVNTNLNKNILIWNHYGFTNINGDKVNILNNESYTDEYSFAISNYILVPNYDEKYEFKSFYIIDMTNNKSIKWDIDKEISSDFYFLGEYKNKGYIIDSKKQVEYEINPKKKTIEEVSKNGVGKIWDEGWKEESIVRLSSNKYEFNIPNFVNYHIKDNKLYLTPKNMSNVLVSNLNITKIIKQDGLDVYYLVGNKLYYYSPFYGEVLVAEYSEFEFNKGLSIYIY